MSVRNDIKGYIASQAEPKRSDMQQLHDAILKLMPGCKLWFLDGRDETGRVVTNPNIGYGACTLKYADGTTREFYQVGISANTTGISIYVMGIDDKKFLAEKFGKRIGKATITGYCIKFRKLADVDMGVLAEAIRGGIERARS